MKSFAVDRCPRRASKNVTKNGELSAGSTFWLFTPTAASPATQWINCPEPSPAVRFDLVEMM